MIPLKTIKQSVIIGMPVYERAWILPDWFRCVTNQIGIDLENTELIFAITDGDDNTREVIESYRPQFKDVTLIDCNDLQAYRDRNQARFFPLVTLRNRIVEVLREKQPDLYFSWDSDIMLPDDALITLVEDDKDIVSPYVELVPKIPNCAHKGAKDSFVRKKPYFQWYPKGELYKVDTVFACFLMKSKVFNECLYAYHTGGEDFGFGLQVLEKGLESWMESRVEGNHIYKKF